MGASHSLIHNSLLVSAECRCFLLPLLALSPNLVGTPYDDTYLFCKASPRSMSKMAVRV